jgi:hypothetical protein
MSNNRLTIGPAHLLTGNGSPIDLGIQAPTGSLYLDQSGSSKMWIEAGTIGQGGGGGGKTVQEVTAATFVDRTAGSSEGDVLQVTDRDKAYFWSVTANEWLPGDYYQGTIVAGPSIVGTESTMAELTGDGWTDATASTVTVSSDGTRTTLQNASGVSDRFLRAVFGAAANGYWMQGYMQVTVGAGCGAGIMGANQTNGDILYFGPYDATNARMKNFSSVVGYAQNTTGFSNYPSDVDLTTAEVWVEAMVRNGTHPNLYVWIDHNPTPHRIGDMLSGASLSGQISLFWRRTSTGNGTTVVRQLTTGEW